MTPDQKSLTAPACAWLCLAVPGCAWLCLAVPGAVRRAVPGCALLGHGRNGDEVPRGLGAEGAGRAEMSTAWHTQNSVRRNGAHGHERPILLTNVLLHACAVQATQVHAPDHATGPRVQSGPTCHLELMLAHFFHIGRHVQMRLPCALGEQAQGRARSGTLSHKGGGMTHGLRCKAISKACVGVALLSDNTDYVLLSRYRCAFAQH